MASDLDQRRGLSFQHSEFLRNQSDVKNFLQKLRTYLLLCLHLLVQLRFRLHAHRQLAGLTFKTILQAVLLKNYFSEITEVWKALNLGHLHLCRYACEVVLGLASEQHQRSDDEGSEAESHQDRLSLQLSLGEFLASSRFSARPTP